MDEPNMNKCILVVDDDQDLIMLLTERLQSWGYRVLVAPDGKAGSRIAAEQLPDLIILDMLMPDWDGILTCAVLRKQPSTKEIPIIFLSALCPDPGPVRSVGPGPACWTLGKPFKSEELLEVVRKVLKEPQESILEKS